MKTIKIFIASSSELKDDRDQFRMFISQENDKLHEKGVYLKIVQWENFLDTISDTRLQDEYNNAIKECDIVLCLLFTKIGKYTSEEFDTAYQVFKDKGKPKIWTYFKNAPVNTGSITDDINTLLAFKERIRGLGHFITEYTNIDNLINKYRTQLDSFLPQFEVSSKPVDIAIEKGGFPSIGQQAVTNEFNVFLTKTLIEAIKAYNKKANDFLTTHTDWESIKDLIPTAKRIIISGYVGVLGMQLRKLMSIGEEDFSNGKMKRYLENCQLTVKRALQLICYALLSKLWDSQLSNSRKLSQSQAIKLVKFFKNPTESSISDLTDLLKALIEAFIENNLDLPIPQLRTLLPNLEGRSSFMDACNSLNGVTDLLNKSYYTVNDCIEKEKGLAIILEKLNFLAEYKMVSIKSSDYFLQRNEKEGTYLHNYSLVDGNSQANNASYGKVRKENSPIISYSVLLFKDNYRQSINIAPFIIDYNALGLTGGSKICFYSFCNTYDDFNLNYSFIEDNSKVVIVKSKNVPPDDKDSQAINRWLANPENRRDMNFDNVFNLFNEAKRILTGLKEEVAEDTL